MHGALFLVPMTGGLVGNNDNTALFQLFYVVRQSAVGYVEARCKLIHVHSVIRQKSFDDLDPDIGTQSFEYFQALIKCFDMQHDFLRLMLIALAKIKYRV
jgi:hypothetical protein